MPAHFHGADGSWIPDSHPLWRVAPPRCLASVLSTGPYGDEKLIVRSPVARGCLTLPALVIKADWGFHVLDGLNLPLAKFVFLMMVQVPACYIRAFVLRLKDGRQTGKFSMLPSTFSGNVEFRWDRGVILAGAYFRPATVGRRVRGGWGARRFNEKIIFLLLSVYTRIVQYRS